MNWSDKFNKILELELPMESNKVWKFALEENRTKGTMQMNVRKFTLAKVEGGYEGPTKNGFLQGINSIEDIEQMQAKFNEFFDEAKKML
jgi:hypothetical protein